MLGKSGYNIDINVCQNLEDSMPVELPTIIESKGNPTNTNVLHKILCV